MRLGCFARNACRRALDLTKPRDAERAGQGYYTIGSSGSRRHGRRGTLHCAPPIPRFCTTVMRRFRLPAVRSGAWPKSMTWDMLLSFACSSSEDPISVAGGTRFWAPRRCAFPRRPRPSRQPSAQGGRGRLCHQRCAPAQARTRRHFPKTPSSMCSFGDASANHSTAQGAFNTAQAGPVLSVSSPAPCCFVCEDNGIGISTKTPQAGSAATFQNRTGLKYFRCNCLDTVRHIPR